jgi:DNA-binding response OmpR family regulator
LREAASWDSRWTAMKRILVVDDEPEMLEVLQDVLHEYDVDTAQDFDTACEYMDTGDYDLVILDIMGVRGMDLLDYAVKKNFHAVMLTAHALDPGTVMESMMRGALSFMPKEDIYRLDSLVAELFRLIADGESTWTHTMKRLAPVLDESFSKDWRDAYKEMGLTDF